MTVPHLTYTELKDKYLIPNGYEVVVGQPDYWDQHNRIIFRKGDITFPFQYKKVYFYLEIVV